MQVLLLLLTATNVCCILLNNLRKPQSKSCHENTVTNDNCSLSAEIAPLHFVGPYHLISIMYTNIQNPLCVFVASYLFIPS